MTTIASRPLGQIETSMALMHQLNGSTQTTSLLSVGGTLPTEIINQAAAAPQHAAAQAIIVRAGHLISGSRDADAHRLATLQGGADALQ